MEIYFPEYKDVFGKVDGAFCMEVLKTAPFPEDIRALGTDGIRNIWHEAKLRGRGYSRAALILKMAQDSVGLKGGTAAAEQKVKWLAEKIQEFGEKLGSIEKQLREKCMGIPHAANIIEINGIGENTLLGILAEMGDISRFDDVKENPEVEWSGACSRFLLWN